MHTKQTHLVAINKFFVGTVIHGKHLGRTIKFPTANIQALDIADTSMIAPGTYSGKCLIGTFADHYARRKTSNKSLADFVQHLQKNIYNVMLCYKANTRIREAHLIDFDGDLYNQQLTIAVHTKIRDNQHFDTLGQLQQQLAHDLEYCRQYQCTSMHFGTFDLLHPGHIRVLRHTSMLATQIHTIITHDIHKKEEQIYNATQRQQQLIQLGRHRHTVDIGHPSDYLFHINRITPQRICIGYDQHHAQHILANYTHDCQIFSVDPFKQDIYKSSILRAQKNNHI